jgi:shikimate kinase/3-dehydroquinate synthase
VAQGVSRPAIVFIGFMGAGKTTAARALDPEAADADALLEERLGTTIAAYFDSHGEAAFRAEEERLVLELLARADGGAVALGGGALGSPRVRDALTRHRAVWLEIDADRAWRRAEGGPDDAAAADSSEPGRRAGGSAVRPLARDEAAFRALHADREPVYLAAADAILPDGADLDRAAAALRDFDRVPAGARLLWSLAGQHPVWIGRGIVGSGYWPLEGRRFLVTDGRVGRLYAEALEPLAGRVTIMPGEQSKTVAHAEIVWTELARAGMTRADHVAALGGGVVGDLAGFAAATYQRGVPVVQVPTTLVAQVDSAYGGKTGVDLPEAKNYVGAYHQPAAVLVDPATLKTLPPEELAAGYAEVLKTALIAGGELWERVRSGAIAEDDVILGCARTKLAIVGADERDAGLRQVLNLGHTVGHAIETATGYARYRHGEAVALGLLATLRLSGQASLRTEVAALLAARGLPTQLTEVDPEAVLAAVELDKKRLGEGPVPFVLVDAPGEVHAGRPVAPDDLRAAVTELLA